MPFKDGHERPLAYMSYVSETVVCFFVQDQGFFSVLDPRWGRGGWVGGNKHYYRERNWITIQSLSVRGPLQTFLPQNEPKATLYANSP